MFGRTIVVGGQGAAYVFVRPNSGWSRSVTEAAVLTPSDDPGDGSFGTSVAISGSTIVVGAPHHPATSGPQRLNGEAYVFQKPAAGWSGALHESAKLLDLNGPQPRLPAGVPVVIGAGDQFGYSVAVSGNTIVVGARLRSTGAHTQGNAFVFTEPRSGWSGAPAPAATLTPATVPPAMSLASQPRSRATRSLSARCSAMWGIAAPKATCTSLRSPAPDGRGSRHRPPRSWRPAATSATISGTRLPSPAGQSLSARRSAHPGAGQYQGEAYVFTRPPSGWSGTRTENATLTAAGGTVGDLFGMAVAVSGTTIVSGECHNAGRRTGQGAAFVFTRPKSGWFGPLTQTAKLPPSGGSGSGCFGASVATAGTTIVAGAPQQTVHGHQQQGAAYVF